MDIEPLAGAAEQMAALARRPTATHTATMITDWPEPLVIDQGPETLFGEPDEAWFNLARTHRYLLTRRWGEGEPMNVIGLNPSKANAFINDPTIVRVAGFARREGCGWVRMLNIYGLKSTDPHLLREHPDPVGLSNDLILEVFATGLVVAAWGAGGKLNGRGEQVAARLTAAGVRLHCLGTTRDGQPRHPLYVRGNQPLIPYEPETGSLSGYRRAS
jgi:hypothetical protein